MVRWFVVWGGRILGTIGRDRVVLVREDWMGRNEFFFGRKRVEVDVSILFVRVFLLNKGVVGFFYSRSRDYRS